MLGLFDSPGLLTLKIRNRYRFNRLWLSLAAILLGILAGYFVGRQSILHAVKARMGDYADRILQRDEDVSTEIIEVMRQADASSFPPCSDGDLILLHRLTFSARFLKDVGRLQNGQFLCSAVAGKLTDAVSLGTPDLTFPSGMRLFKSQPLVVPHGVRAEVIALGSSDVVLSPDIFSEFSQEPLHFAVGVPNRNGKALPEVVGNAPGVLPRDEAEDAELTGTWGTMKPPPGILSSVRARRVGDTIYLARCSNRYPVCAVSSIAVARIWQLNRGLLYLYTATGAVAGICCATALLMVGRKRRSQTSQLKRAILMGKLSVAYQPIVEMGTRRIVGAEALARWTDEAGDSIRPETIIALAEAEGFVSEITRFVITRSMEEIRPILQWIPNFRLSINLAPSDLADPRLLILLDERLQGGPLTAANVAFELPERATVNYETAVAAIKRLRDRGHATFIDDFGTGYSNLAYLSELKVDGIKINRSFIATVGTESVTASIVPQILAVAKALNLKVVVQGIEREEQANYFATDDPLILGQGWFFGLPIPAQGLAYLCAERSE
jgi:sensor c-di-GMP phosphodiesterase-like protein